MHKLSVVFIALGLLATAGACSKDKNKDGEAASAAAPAPAPAFTGTLDAAAIGSASGIVQPFDIWTEGFAKLKSKMGEPTLVEENRYYWGAMDGESCTYIYVSKDNEAEFFKDKPDPQDMIGTVAKATTVTKDKDGEYAACTKAAGMAPEPAGDPDPAADEADAESESDAG